MLRGVSAGVFLEVDNGLMKYSDVNHGGGNAGRGVVGKNVPCFSLALLRAEWYNDMEFGRCAEGRRMDEDAVRPRPFQQVLARWR